MSPKVGYNVDSFGHPATLPDVLAAHGYAGYVFHRPGAHQVELPAQTFRWRGASGGEVIGFRISPAYVTFSDDLYGQIMLSIEGGGPRTRTHDVLLRGWQPRRRTDQGQHRVHPREAKAFPVQS